MVYDEKRRSAMHMIDDKGDTTRSRSLIDFEPRRENGRRKKVASEPAASIDVGYRRV